METTTSELSISKDAPEEKCGVFGIYSRNVAAAPLVYYGLWALQHRGQESSGISASDGKRIRTKKDGGLVAYVYQEDDLEKLKGHLAIGHNRYGTSGGKGAAHAQPVVDSDNEIALVHNGNLFSIKKLEDFLKSKRIKTEGFNDSELMQKALKYYLSRGHTIESAVENCFPMFTGTFCLVLLMRDKIIAVRDPAGIRPMSIGKLKGGYAISSETCGLDAVAATYVRDIRPGEMVVIDDKGLRSHKLVKGTQKLDIFEFIYFARRDSNLLGKNVDEVRKSLGRQLARECLKLKADVVIPVPDSSIPATLGFAYEMGIPFDHGFVKNRYVHRTFIRPHQELREMGVKVKINPLPQAVKGKDVIVVDDSIVRGTTTRAIVTMLRRAGAKKVHVAVGSPPIKYPDFYGIDTPQQKHLIASEMSVPQIKDFVGADSLHYLSYAGLVKGVGLPEEMLCMAALNGKYPIDLLERNAEVDFSK